MRNGIIYGWTKGKLLRFVLAVIINKGRDH